MYKMAKGSDNSHNQEAPPRRTPPEPGFCLLSGQKVTLQWKSMPKRRCHRDYGAGLMK